LLRESTATSAVVLSNHDGVFLIPYPAVGNRRRKITAPGFHAANGVTVQVGHNATQYQPAGSTCGDGQTTNQSCYLVHEQGFGTVQTIYTLYRPRVFQFSLK
jgi:hypothetical protein